MAVNNNTVSEAGDAIIIKLVTPYKEVEEILSYSDEITGETTDGYNRFDRFFRWSVDNKSFSEFIPLTDLNLQRLVLDPNNDFWIEYKYIAAELETGNTMTFNGISLEVITANGALQEIPLTQCCDDPWDNTGCQNLIVDDCCQDNQFNPYDLTGAVNLYTQLNNTISDIFGECVTYYKVDPNLDTKDIILKEYSRYNLISKKEIKVLVPDNEYPTRAFQFTMQGMDFPEEWEVHITRDEFEEMFGARTRPTQRDILYFPKIDQLFEVNSVALADEFNMSMTYYRVLLKKYEEKENVEIEDVAIKEELKELAVTVDDVFSEEREDEELLVTKPLQYNTIGTGADDYVRSLVDRELDINDENINNNWTIVSKNYYDLTSVENGSVAAKYRLPVTQTVDENRTFSFWFRWNSTVQGAKLSTKNISNFINNDGKLQIQVTGSHGYTQGDIVKINGTESYSGLYTVISILDEFNFIVNENYVSGIIIDTSSTITVSFKESFQPFYGYGIGSSGMSLIVINGETQVNINTDRYTFDFSSEVSEFEDGKWYSAIINLNNKFNQLGFYLYEMDKPLTNSMPQSQDTELTQKYRNIIDITDKYNVDSGDYWMLLGGSADVTNLRIFNATINEEDHSAVLNQYVVRDSQYALLVDNAVPQLKLQKLKNPR